MKNMSKNMYGLSQQQIEKEIKQLEREIDREYIRLGQSLTQMTETCVARINHMSKQVVEYRQYLDQQRYNS